MLRRNLSLLREAILLVAVFTAVGAVPDDGFAWIGSIPSGSEQVSTIYLTRPGAARSSFATGHIDEYSWCSGVMIAPNVFATAGHCLEWASGGSLDPRDVRFRTYTDTGSTTNGMGETYNDDLFMCYPLMTTWVDTDLALMYCPNKINSAGQSYGPGDLYGYADVSTYSPGSATYVYSIWTNSVCDRTANGGVWPDYVLAPQQYIWTEGTVGGTVGNNDVGNPTTSGALDHALCVYSGGVWYNNLSSQLTKARAMSLPLAPAGSGSPVFDENNRLVYLSSEGDVSVDCAHTPNGSGGYKPSTPSGTRTAVSWQDLMDYAWLPTISSPSSDKQCLPSSAQTYSAWQVYSDGTSGTSFNARSVSYVGDYLDQDGDHVVDAVSDLENDFPVNSQDICFLDAQSPRIASLWNVNAGFVADPVGGYDAFTLAYTSYQYTSYSAIRLEPNTTYALEFSAMWMSGASGGDYVYIYAGSTYVGRYNYGSPSTLKPVRLPFTTGSSGADSLAMYAYVAATGGAFLFSDLRIQKVSDAVADYALFDFDRHASRVNWQYESDWKPAPILPEGVNDHGEAADFAGYLGHDDRVVLHRGIVFQPGYDYEICASWQPRGVYGAGGYYYDKFKVELMASNLGSVDYWLSPALARWSSGWSTTCGTVTVPSSAQWLYLRFSQYYAESEALIDNIKVRRL